MNSEQNAPLAQAIRQGSLAIDLHNLVKGCRILLCGENHRNLAAKTYLATHAQELREAGITHYAIEAPPNAAFEHLNSGLSVDLGEVKVGPSGMGADGEYARAIAEMSANGITILPLDVPQGTAPSHNRREAHMTDQIMAVLNADPEARILVLIGGMHANRSALDSPDGSLAQRLSQQGFDVTAVQIVGGSNCRTPFSAGATQAGAANKEFMLYADRTISESIYGGRVDVVIHLPQESIEASGLE